MSCNKKTVDQELDSLKCGEKTTITEQNFCDKILNTEVVDTITFDTKTYQTERKCALIKGISGSIDYCMSDDKKEFNITIISNESSLMPLSAIVERTH